MFPLRAFATVTATGVEKLGDTPRLEGIEAVDEAIGFAWGFRNAFSADFECSRALAPAVTTATETRAWPPVAIVAWLWDEALSTGRAGLTGAATEAIPTRVASRVSSRVAGVAWTEESVATAFDGSPGTSDETGARVSRLSVKGRKQRALQGGQHGLHVLESKV